MLLTIYSVLCDFKFCNHNGETKFKSTKKVNFRLEAESEDFADKIFNEAKVYIRELEDSGGLGYNESIIRVSNENSIIDSVSRGKDIRTPIIRYFYSTDTGSYISIKIFVNGLYLHEEDLNTNIIFYFKKGESRKNEN